jgi:hypothetical protein
MEQLLQPLREYGQFVVANWVWLTLAAVAMAVIITSGGFAAAIAERRNRGPLRHFALGCLAPVIYPLMIQATLKHYTGESSSRRREADQDEGFQRVEGAPPPGGPPVLSPTSDAPPVIDEEILGQPRIQFDESFFRQMTYDAKGGFRGPFEFIVNGTQVKVERIVEVLESVVVVENVNADGKPQRLRIPYSKVESCKELS